ncbi:MAG: hypothetical protein WC623_24780 [Pedobacter sp.]|uniref:rolling circle replication-associated protein n=1 Tax=Pedobacter sp. TaxID=1411316 RepID=UPI00356259DB
MSEIYSESQNLQEPIVPGLCVAGCNPDRSGRGEALPCLFSNNSTENSENEKTEALKSLVSILSPYHKKAAQRLYLDVERIIKLAPSVGHVGMLTITNKSNITDPKEFSRLFDSFNTHFLKPHLELKDWLLVQEPQERGSLHYHLLIITSQDIRTGLNFDEIAKRQYRSASPFLKGLWADLRDACEKYGLGRHELLPIKSNSEAMGRYLGSYISKGLQHRTPEQKGSRFVRYSQGWAHNSVNFQWHTENSKKWRKLVKMFAEYHGCSDLYQLNELLGPGWAWKYIEDIMTIEGAVIESFFENGTKQHCPEYQDKKIKVTNENRQKRERLERKNPNVVRRNSEMQNIKAKSKSEVALDKSMYQENESIMEKAKWEGFEGEILNRAKISLESKKRVAWAKWKSVYLNKKLLLQEEIPF